MSTVFSRISDWLARTMPTHEQMAQNRYVPKSALRAELWRFTRRSVPRGVALGVVVGVLVPFAQIVFAAILCLPVRANVPLAALTTFLTNPFTTPLIWAFSYQVGRWFLPVNDLTLKGPIESFFGITDIMSFLHWVTDEGKVLVFGLVVVSVVAACIGYVASGCVWKMLILRKRKRRISQ
jgi:uncharacterized protein